MDDFAGKAAIVAGGSKGIGKAAARRLAAGGATVVLCGRAAGTVEETVAELRGEGLAVDGLAADVGRGDEVDRLFAYALERTGGALDVLVNSAGVQRYGTVTETDEALWDEVMTINLKSMYLASRRAIPELRRRGGGVIVNVSSVQGLATQRGVAAYSTSKAAINGLTRAMALDHAAEGIRVVALDHAAEGIRVVAVCPGAIETPMLRHSADLFKGAGSRDETLRAWGTTHPIGRLGQPEEVAELIAFLAGPKAGFITGGEYKIDGGLCTQLALVLPENAG